MKRKMIFTDTLTKDLAYAECVFVNIDFTKIFTPTEEVSFGACKFKKCILPPTCACVLGEVENCVLTPEAICKMHGVTVTACEIAEAKLV